MPSIPSNIMKVFGQIADNPYVNSFFLASSFAAMTSSGIGTTMNAAQDAFAVDRNTFERAGHGIGETLAGGADSVMAGTWLAHGISRQKPMHADAFIAKEGGGLFAKSGNSVAPVGAGGKLGAQLAEKEGAAIMANASKRGVIGGGSILGGKGKFLKNAGWGLGAATILAPMAMHMLVAPVLGFAGKLVDEMYDQSRKARTMKYDERYIVNQQQDMTTNQQVGAAMDSYQNKMMSMGRIFHSR